MSMKNILTYKFSMIAFCPCTLPPLKRRETNIKCYWLTTRILKSKKIFKYKGRNKTNYSSPYTFRKFEISNCFTFLGILAIKKLWFQWNIYYLTSNIIEVKFTLLQISLRSNIKVSVMTASIIYLSDQLP